jgi:hypothetical protein
VTKLQKFFVTVCGAALAALFVSGKPALGLIQSQRDQMFVAIIVNVTPAPVAMRAPASTAQDAVPPIAARFALRARGAADGLDSTFAANAGALIAQSTNQSAIRVQAQVTPNPMGTLLTVNQSSVTMSGTAGTTIKQKCIYTVSVDTTVTSWTLREGLSSDFTTGWSGTSLANDSYLQAATPAPTSTPFVVYPSAWTILNSNSLAKTYCVDLTLTIPSTVAGGTYSTNAVYTLYY